MPSPRMAVVYEKLYQAVCNQNMNRVLGLVLHGKVQEAQLQIAGVIGNRAHIFKDLLQTGLQEVLIGVLLNPQHVGHFQDLIVLLIGLSEGFAVVYVFHHRHCDITRPFLPGFPGKSPA